MSHLLLSAEIARIENRHPDAANLYDRVLKSAQDTDNLQNEALAYELCARFGIGQYSEKIGEVFLREACNRYAELQATGKSGICKKSIPALKGSTTRMARSVDYATIVP